MSVSSLKKSGEEVITDNFSNYKHPLIAGKKIEAQQKKILIIDDDLDQLYLFSEFVSSLGFQTVCEASGFSALSRLKRGDIDLIVSDLVLPHMSARDFIIKLKKIDYISNKQKECPIIVMSASHVSESEQKNLLYAGADMFADKMNWKSLLPKQIEFLLEYDC